MDLLVPSSKWFVIPWLRNCVICVRIIYHRDDNLRSEGETISFVYRIDCRRETPPPALDEVLLPSIFQQHPDNSEYSRYPRQAQFARLIRRLNPCHSTSTIDSSPLRVDYSGATRAVRGGINVSLLGSHYRSMNLSLNGERNMLRSARALWYAHWVLYVNYYVIESYVPRSSFISKL